MSQASRRPHPRDSGLPSHRAMGRREDMRPDFNYVDDSRIIVVPRRSSTRMSVVEYRRPSVHAKPIFFVPDPPAWDAQVASPRPREEHHDTPSGKSSAKSDIADDAALSRPAQSTLKPDPASQKARFSTVDRTGGLPSPPPTPEIPRLKTPDLEPHDLERPFCGCCTTFGSSSHGKSKMELQIQTALEHIQRTRRSTP